MLNSKGFMGFNLSLAHCRTVNVKRGDTADQLCWGFSVVSGEHLQGFLKNVWVCVGVVQVLHIFRDVNTFLYGHKCKYVLEYANALCILYMYLYMHKVFAFAFVLVTFYLGLYLFLYV